MDAVPSLCATGTVGVAAIGHALGRLSSPDPRPRSNKRKAGNVMSSDFYKPFAPSTPTGSSQTSSAPSTQPPNPGRLRRPQSASFPRNSPLGSDAGVSEEYIAEEGDWGPSTFASREPRPVDHVGMDAVNSASGTAKSSWFRRMSTFSSLQNESPPSLSCPGTPSLSFSNGSTAPIIPSVHASPATPRNRLVKRTSSQRALHGTGVNQANYSSSQIPTLRRPATSHQRSATLREQLFENNVSLQHEVARPSFQQEDISNAARDHETGPSAQKWQPFFRRRDIRFVGDTPTKSGATLRKAARIRSIKFITPAQGDIPILLKPGSITNPALDEVFQVPSTPPFYSTPSTPLTNDLFLDSSSKTTESRVELEPRPRNSFSIGDYFPTPSPSWKIRRNSVTRKNKGSDGASVGRRVSSAPQLPKEVRTQDAQHPNLTPQTRLQGALLRHSPSSPLPPLNRVSTFEIDIPPSTSSDPPSPRPQYRSSPSSPISPSPGSVPTATSQAASKIKPHRPSGAPSDRASTLVGSDNENSRVFTGDFDETDARSDTVYDSVRTGATGSSHSGVRGPKIETVFDSSPPLDLLSHNLTVLQEKLSNPNILREFIVEEEDSLRTPIGIGRSFEDNLPTPSHYSTQPPSSSDIGSSPLVIPATPMTNHKEGTSPAELNENEDWSMNDEDAFWDHQETITNLSNLEITPHTNRRGSAQESTNARVNLFEWSERNPLEHATPDGRSPRPSTAHVQQSTERGTRATGRRGLGSAHSRSQSVPLSPESSGHRAHTNPSNLDGWVLGSKGVSEDWDNDFDFDEPVKTINEGNPSGGNVGTDGSGGMKVPTAILERQGSVHRQFQHVTELTLLVDDLRRLRDRASEYGILHGQSSELWKEAEGIINLATLDDEEQELFPPRSPRSPSFDSDLFDTETPPQRRQKLQFPDPSGSPTPHQEHIGSRSLVPQSSPTPSSKTVSTSHGRPRQDSEAHAKSVLEHIHQQRSPAGLAGPRSTPKKLPFDTTSLRDLVTRAGVVTRALMEIIRQVENKDNQKGKSVPQFDGCDEYDDDYDTPPDPAFSQIFRQPSHSPPPNRSPRSVKSKGSNHNGFLTGNDNDINGHMKMMTVV